MSHRNKFIGVLFLAMPMTLSAEHVGLKPSFFSLGSAEAITSSVSGADAIFYNPAGLAWMDFSVRLVGVEETGDSHSLETIDKILASDNPEDSLNLPTLFERLNSDNPIYVRTTVRALDVVLPFVAISSFLEGEALSRNYTDEEGQSKHEMVIQADVGLSVGLGWRFDKLGMGVSYYRMGRSKIRSTPTTAQRDAAIEALSNEQLEENTVPFREFTEFYYGGGEGYNIGLQYRPNPDGYTGFGLAVLNAGGTKFNDSIKFDDPTVDEMEAELIEGVEKYNVELDVPEAIPEIVNLGASFGLTDKKSPFHFVVNLEASDVTGSYIKEKVAFSAKIGLTLPDSLALGLSAPVMPLDENRKSYIHAGVLGLYVFGGYRPDAYQSVGATLALHAGANRILSLFKFELTAMALSPLNENSKYIEQAGTLYSAGLTFIVN